MSRFFGTFHPKLDDKGRLFLPAKFRDQLKEGLVITRGQERCLYVWTVERFDRLADEADLDSFRSRRNRDFERQLFSGAADMVPDKQGRISIPANLREWGGLSKDCVVIGASNRVEIWDAEAWTEYDARTAELFADMSDDASGEGSPN